MDLVALQHRLRVIQSLRFMVVSAVILVVTAFAGLSAGIITLVPALLLSLFLKDESFANGLALMTGTAFGVVFIFVNTYFWAQVPLFYLLASMAMLGALFYWVGQGVRGRWPYIAFPLGAALSILSGVFSEISGAQDGIEAALVWLRELPLGVLVFWIVMLGLWPSPTARDLARLVDAIERECETLLRQTSHAVLAGTDQVAVPSQLSLKYFGDAARLIRQNAGRLRSSEGGHSLLLARLDVLSDIYADIRFIQRSFEELPEPGYPPEARAAAAEIVSALSEQIIAGSSPELTGPFATIEEAERTLTAAASADPAARRLAARLSGFSVAAKSLVQSLASEETPLSAPPPANETATRKPFRIEADSLQATGKTIIGVLFGIALILLTDMPASAYLVIAILIILAQPNLGRAHLRIRLWFPGVLAGSLWAFAGLLVLSYLPYFGIYLVWFLPGLFVAGYFGLGPDRVSYMGIQMVAGMSTIMGMANFPAETILSAEARILGACLGFLIALAVNHILWPAHPANLLRASIARNLREIARLFSSLSSSETAMGQADLIADVDRRIAKLKTQIEADFGLLFDFSYVMSKKVRPAYDYHLLAREAALMFAQLWCLRHSPLMLGDRASREGVRAPLLATEPHVAAILMHLADRLDGALSASAEEYEPAIAEITDQLRKLQDDDLAIPAPYSHEYLVYGTNTVNLLTIHILRFAGAMDTRSAPRPLKTARLAELYEGAYR